MKHVFVWTIGDMVALGFVGLLILLGLLFAGLIAWEKLTRKFKGWFKRNA